MVQMQGTDSGPQLVAAGSAGLPRDCLDDSSEWLEWLIKGIRSVLAVGLFTTRQCILSLPARATFIHHAKLPKLPPEQLPGALKWELQDKLPYPVEEAIIRHVVAGDVFGDGEAKQEVIVVAVPRSTVQSCLDMSRRLKLDVIGLNIEPCAIVECFARLFRRDSDSTRTTIYVDMGAASTQVVLARGPRIVFARNLTVGGRDLDAVAAEKLGVSVEQANHIRRQALAEQTGSPGPQEVMGLLKEPIAELVEELTQCMRYHESVFRGQPVERMVFLGGQAYDKRLCQIIAQRLELPAQIGDPLVQVSRAGGAATGAALDIAGPRPDWAVAIGLSLGADQAA